MCSCIWIKWEDLVRLFRNSEAVTRIAPSAMDWTVKYYADVMTLPSWTQKARARFPDTDHFHNEVTP